MYDMTYLMTQSYDMAYDMVWQWYNMTWHDMKWDDITLFFWTLQVNHCIDEMTKIQSALDQSTEVVRDLEGEKRIHERRVGELENVAASLKTKLSEMRHLKNDEHVMQQRLLSEARKREGNLLCSRAFKFKEQKVCWIVKLSKTWH